MNTNYQPQREIPCPDGIPLPGAVVRTRRRWAGGVHRAPVKEVTVLGGTHWVHGADWAFPLADMEVIRNALHPS